MPTVKDILATKGSTIYSVPSTATVLEATHLMNERRIGALVVMDGQQIVGMFTERDVLQRVVEQQLQPAQVTVGQVMSQQVIYCTPDMRLEEASQIMRDRRIRHLPVCDANGQLLGLISIGDINAMHASSQEIEIRFLRDYIYGRA